MRKDKDLAPYTSREKKSPASSPASTKPTASTPDKTTPTLVSGGNLDTQVADLQRLGVSQQQQTLADLGRTFGNHHVQQVVQRLQGQSHASAGRQGGTAPVIQTRDPDEQEAETPVLTDASLMPHLPDIISPTEPGSETKASEATETAPSDHNLTANPQGVPEVAQIHAEKETVQQTQQTAHQTEADTLLSEAQAKQMNLRATVAETANSQPAPPPAPEAIDIPTPDQMEPSEAMPSIADQQPDLVEAPLANLTETSAGQFGTTLAHLQTDLPDLVAETNTALETAIPAEIAVPPALFPYPEPEAPQEAGLAETVPTELPSLTETEAAAALIEASQIEVNQIEANQTEETQTALTQVDKQMASTQQADKTQQQEHPNQALTRSHAPTEAGPRPKIPLTGETNPAQMTAQHITKQGALEAEQTQVEAFINTTDFGENSLTPGQPMPPMTVEATLPTPDTDPLPAMPELEGVSDAPSASPLLAANEAILEENVGNVLATEGSNVLAAHSEQQATQQATLEIAQQEMQAQMGAHVADFENQRQALATDTQAEVATMRQDWQVEQAAISQTTLAEMDTLHTEGQQTIDQFVTEGETRMADRMTETEQKMAQRKDTVETQANTTLQQGQQQAASALAGVGLGLDGQYEANAVQSNSILMRREIAGPDEGFDEDSLIAEQQAAQEEAQTTMDTAVEDAQAVLDELLVEIQGYLDALDNANEVEMAQIKALIQEKLAEVKTIISDLKEQTTEDTQGLVLESVNEIKDRIAETYQQINVELKMMRLVEFSAQEGQAWTPEERRTVREASWQVANTIADTYNEGRPADEQLSPTEAFLGIFQEPIDFQRIGAESDRGAWGNSWAQGSDYDSRIDVYANAPAEGVASSPNFVIHEIGHLFVGAVSSANEGRDLDASYFTDYLYADHATDAAIAPSGPGTRNPFLPDQIVGGAQVNRTLPMRTDDDDGFYTGTVEEENYDLNAFQQSDERTSFEEFADMFLGWSYTGQEFGGVQGDQGMWSADEDGNYTENGEEMADFMDDLMPVWIEETIDQNLNNQG